MAKLERATQRGSAAKSAVTLNGRAIEIPDFDALTFAKTLGRRKAKPKTLAEREARLRAAEAKIGRR